MSQAHFFGTHQAVMASPIAMFEEQAQRVPTAVAIKEEGRCVTYRELNDRADILAGALASKGVKIGNHIALFMPRSIDFVIAVLAVLKTGAAYVPIDTASPTQRLQRILARCEPALVISAGGISLPSIDWPALSIDELCEHAASHGPSAMPTAKGEDGIAYVLHTSGTTGEPNGVQITCRGLANYLTWAARTYASKGVYDALWHTATTFDLSITSFLVPLVAGGCVDIVTGVNALESLLARLDANQEPCVVKVTPTHVRAIVKWFELQAKVNPSALVFVIGGEELFVRDAKALSRLFPNGRIYNEYGPTEATVGCCVQQWDERVVADDECVPIGTPIVDMAMYIVDEHGRRAVEGQRGEIAIAGPGVMRGYLGNDALTAQKLVQPSWLDTPCYLTGDTGELRSDGTYLYHGRSDTQVKLNGYRIELGEIEALALESAHVRHAAAIMKTVGDVSMLTLFVETAAPGSEREVEEVLARELARKLPDYMCPRRIVAMRSLPVTSHDKIDRRALSQTMIEPVRSLAASAPGDMIEDALTAIWRRVLPCESVGLDDNYFSLGGDSLRSIEITALAEERGIRFSIPTLHQHPTVRALAKVVRGEPDLVEVQGTQALCLISEADQGKLPPDVEDAYPLNLLQEGMIYHREFAAKSAVYHAICSYHVAMPVDVQAMRDAVHELVARHPLLRTSFDLTRYSRPLQLVHRASTPEFGYLDLRQADSATHQDWVDAWLEDEKKRGFEIEQYPLIRFMLHHFADDSCQLSYSFHHEIIDGWSDALMVTELMNRYMSRVTGEPFGEQPLRSTFRDAILLEQQAVEDRRYSEFWNERMRDVSVMRLPSFVPPRADRGQREIIKFELPIDVCLSNALKRLARELAVPLKSVLLAAHMKVMSLLGGSDDVMSYTVSNGRPENRDSHAVIGLFVNSLAFRMKLPGGSWRELVLNTLQAENEVLTWRRYPMAELKRQHGSEPLSETLFFFNHYHVTDALQRWEQVRLLGLKVYAESTFPYCVNAYLTPFDERLCIRIEYDKLRYEQEVMEVAGHFYLAVLTAMVNDPDANYHADSFLPDDERERFALFSNTKKSEAPGRFNEAFEPVIHRIGVWALRQPLQIALVTPQGQLTYEELDTRVKLAAARLVELGGVRPGDCVGVVMARGESNIVTALAVLKVGAAYLPLGPEQPASRLSGVLQRTADLVVCDDAAHARISPMAGDTLRFVLFDDLVAGGCSERHVDVSIPAQAQAYVICTSGSSGVPKATAVSHGNLHAATAARIAYYDLSADDRCVLLSAPAFDSAVGVIFGALTAGATLIVPDDETMLDLAALNAFMRDAHATMALCTPSLLDTLLMTEGFAQVGLKQIISAGEPLSRDTYATAAALEGVTVFNEYGPTEATVWASVWQGSECRPMPTMPIGRAISTSRLYVLDERLHPVATGVPGELYIGGEGVAIGYLDTFKQTAAAFLPDPFSNVPGARMYRTGDLVRVDLDGNVEFLSRRDRLVKVQGFRVEPGEVEHVLATHASVHRAVVVAKSVNGIKQLAAYVVRHANEQVTEEELKVFCKQNLPKYMVPAHFVFVDAMPLSGTGKVDLVSLEEAARREMPSSAPHVLPQSPLQSMLVEIWRVVLNVDRIGIHDDFAELGGESLAALRIAAKVRSTLGIDVPVRTLLASMTTVAELAGALEVQSRRDAGGFHPEGLEIGEF